MRAHLSWRRDIRTDCLMTHSRGFCMGLTPYCAPPSTPRCTASGGNAFPKWHIRGLVCLTRGRNSCCDMTSRHLSPCLLHLKRVYSNCEAMGSLLCCCNDGDVSSRSPTNQQASGSKKAPAGASEDEVDRLMLQQADESLRKAQEEIERNIGKL